MSVHDYDCAAVSDFQDRFVRQVVGTRTYYAKVAALLGTFSLMRHIWRSSTSVGSHSSGAATREILAVMVSSIPRMSSSFGCHRGGDA
jgi:hypothetical protein